MLYFFWTRLTRALAYCGVFKLKANPIKNNNKKKTTKKEMRIVGLLRDVCECLQSHLINLYRWKFVCSSSHSSSLCLYILFYSHLCCSVAVFVNFAVHSDIHLLRVYVRIVICVYADFKYLNLSFVLSFSLSLSILLAQIRAWMLKQRDKRNETTT